MLLLSLYCKAKALWLTHDRGASAVEYALIVFAIAAIVAAILFTMGGGLNTQFQNACNAVTNPDAC